MRKIMSATVASLAVIGGASAIAGAAQAQTRYYDPYTGRYTYSQPYSQPVNPYYYSQPYGYTQPYGYSQYGYNQPYGYQSYGSNNGLSAGLAVLGSVLGLNTGASGYGYGNVPVDRYGPDPNGMIAPDGHRIKCKLRRTYDNYYRQTVTRRECW